MRVGVTGTSGLIGGTLVSSLLADGHDVRRVVRRRTDVRGDDVFWDPDGGILETGKLEGLDAVVHLAAEPLDTSRWRGDPRERILESRRGATGLLARALAQLERPPGVFVSASAVGYYGDRGDEIVTEESPAGDDFLADVCRQWEEAAAPAAEAGIRTVHPRTGVVIAERGPLMDKVRVPFALGIGGRIGNGRQYVPWIALDDHVRALRFLVEGDLAGPVNLVAPEPATNRELTKALGEAFRRPTVIPIPPLAIRLLYGETAEVLARSSQRVVPTRLLEAGFRHRYVDLLEALRVALGREAS